MGSGGTGGYFGGLLARAGEEVTFIARGAHLEALRMRGLTVRSRLVGELAGGTSARTEQLHGVLQRAEISAEVHPDVRVAIWQKFLFICAFSGVTAITRMPIGPILTDQATRALFRGTLKETEAVARAAGIDLSEDCVEQALATAEAVEPWGRGSMYHDLAHGRRLELEALNGEVVRRGREYDLQTPLNFAIYAALEPYVNGAPVLP